MPPTEEELQAIAEARTAASAAIVASTSRRKLIVAGPGTGKTFTFKQALVQCGQQGLALTFIRNLVRDLEAALRDHADVFTFHGYCKHLLHANPVVGLEDDWTYYPPLLQILAKDHALLGRADVEDSGTIDRCLHDLDDANGLIRETVRLGTYYNAVFHTDLVYRILKHFETNGDDIRVYPLIVVDEYQDFSRLETSFIALLASRSPVIIAGDDDQALYAFKNASARYIRELANGVDYARFELPYCSRCPQVVVDAVRQVIVRAVQNGNLTGRLAKRYECYLPDKLTDSEAHPKIIHADCTVERTNAPYIGRYIVEQLRALPLADIRQSHDAGDPTALVIGPMPFIRSAYDRIHDAYPQAVWKKSAQPEINALDAYRRLARNERSRLGWRILIALQPFQDSDSILADVLDTETELADRIPADYKAIHLQLAALVGRLLDEGELTEVEAQQLQTATSMTHEQLRNILHVDESEEDEPPPEVPRDTPTIVCTSLVGAKGLSAGYVFIVGFNNGHFPRDPNSITDEEVCSFLVGLSRTRKECHVVSCRRFAGTWLQSSKFGDWISDKIEHLLVNRDWFQNRPAPAAG